MGPVRASLRGSGLVASEATGEHVLDELAQPGGGRMVLAELASLTGGPPPPRSHGSSLCRRIRAPQATAVCLRSLRARVRGHRWDGGRAASLRAPSSNLRSFYVNHPGYRDIEV